MTPSDLPRLELMNRAATYAVGVALKYNIDPQLVLAMIEVESGGDPVRVRYEPHYRYLVQPEAFAKAQGISVQTEKELQKISWGLLQVMGGTARDLGYAGPLVSLAHDVGLALDLGVRYLVSRYRAFGQLPEKGTIQGWSDPVIAAYNAGSAKRLANGRWANEDYVRKVEKAYKKIALASK